jgi:hypothetical protein
MKCYICNNSIEHGHIYGWTRSGAICGWCIESNKWFVPEFALGKFGFRQSILETTQPMERSEHDILDLYIG